MCLGKLGKKKKFVFILFIAINIFKASTRLMWKIADPVRGASFAPVRGIPWSGDVIPLRPEL